MVSEVSCDPECYHLESIVDSAQAVNSNFLSHRSSFTVTMNLFIVCLLALLGRIWCQGNAQRSGPQHDSFVVCYFASWSVFRSGLGRFNVPLIEPHLCTHIIYAFAGFEESSSTLISLSNYTDYEANNGRGLFKKVTGLKEQYPHLRVLLSMGGWLQGSERYSRLAASMEKIKTFADSAVTLLRANNFDGLDIDWEFPGQRGGSDSDKENFPILLREVKKEFDKYGLLLTVHLSGKKYVIDSGYDIPEIIQYVDFINLVCYQFNGPWERQTGANAPLKSNNVFNVEYAVNYMISLGAPPEKIVMGLAAYGHTFVLLNELKKGQPVFGFPSSDEKIKGEFSGEDGFIGYNEVCRELAKHNSNWTESWDEATATPFAISSKILMSYDNQRSITKKVDFMLEKRLRGVMLWSIDTDDFRGWCDIPGYPGEESKTYPLLKAANLAILNKGNEIWNTTVFSHEYRR